MNSTKVKKFKVLKICFLVIAFLIGMILISPNKSYAATATVDGITWTYTVSSGKATNVYTTTSITASNLKDGNTLVIPSTLNGYTVESIGYSSTNYNILYKSNSTSNSNNIITKVEIPSSVKTINTHCFRRLTALNEIIGAENVTTIGNYAFYYCSGLTSFEIPSKVVTIGSGAFSNCTNIESFTLPSSLTKIDTNAFQSTKISSLTFNSNVTVESSFVSSCSNLTTIDFNNYNINIGASAFSSASKLTTLLNWDNVTSIGNSAFSSCTGLTSLTLPANLQTIGNNAFQNCTKLTGNLIIPENVTSIGTYAFSGCTSLDGNIEFRTTNLVSISNYAFQNCSKVKKAILPNTIVSVGSYAFSGFKDVYVDAKEEECNISFAANFSGTNTAYIHYLEHKHNVSVDLLPGIKLIDTNTGLEFVPGEYDDGANISVQVSKESGYDYNNLVIFVEKNGDYQNSAKSYTDLNLTNNTTYTDTNLLRDTKFVTLNISNGLDLVARTYIDTINKKVLDESREPQYALVGGAPQYKHTKYPVIVKKGDIIVYKIKIYNEGKVAGKATEIKEYLPEGLEFIADSSINTTYKWTISEDGRTATTDYMKNNNLTAFNGKTAPSSVELSIECRVTKDSDDTKVVRLTNFVEISAQSATDVDSTPNNIDISDAENYKREEAMASNSESFIQSVEDDQDFENVVILRKVPVSYVLKISKVDTKDFQLLNGAKFDLLNENGEVIQSKVTVENGSLTFDKLTTYGAGVDTYYISEAETPVGYTKALDQTIKVSVIKTIVDEISESYSLEIICDLLETRIDTNVDESTIIPIYTKAQLKEVGSGNSVEVKGVTYTFGTNNNYKLMSDIDISGEEWIPLPEIKGVFKGNGKTITGLTITDKNKKDIGLFAKFSGVIDNLTLTGIDITIDLSSELEELEDTYTDPEILAEKIDELLSPYHIGSLVGTMSGGSLLNVTTTGNITTDSNNVGGFIGYAENGHLTKIKNSTNNVNISTSHSNAGGLVGYSYSSLSILNCVNNGKITAGEYNAGGLVGYEEAKGYEANIVKTEYDSQNNIINVIVGNDRYTSSYSLKLNKIDGLTKELLDGTVFTIFDNNKNVLNGLERVTVQDGVLDIGTFEVDSTGTDTYYIKENSTLSGYNLMKDFIKVNVVKSWDGVNSKFKFTVNAENLDTAGFASSEVTTNGTVPSYSGINYVYQQTDNVKWLVNKVVASECKNNGEITAKSNAAGMFAKTNCVVDIEDSKNSGKIYSGGQTAGLIAEALKVDKNTSVTINNSENEEEIILNSCNIDYPNVAGIVAYSKADTIIKNTNNKGEITGVSGLNTIFAGIIATGEEDIHVEECENSGNITNGYIVGGIIGQDLIEGKVPEIQSCKNTGDLSAGFATGGMIAITAGDEVRIYDSSCTDCEMAAGSLVGGMIAQSATDIIIDNCEIDNLTIPNRGQVISSGMIASISEGAFTTTYHGGISRVEIKNCSVKNMSTDNTSNENSAIIGCAWGNSSAPIENVIIKDCTVDNVHIRPKRGHTGMAVAYLANFENIEVSNCDVTNSSIKENANIGGEHGMIIGFTRHDIEAGNQVLLNCDVTDCEIDLKVGGSVSNLWAFNYGGKSVDTSITNCNVKSSPIKNDTGAMTFAGNITGAVYNGGEFSVQNCKVDDSPVTTATTSSGSIVGSGVGMDYANRDVFKNVEITNSTVRSYSASVGGLIGETMISSTNNNYTKETKIDDCKILNTYLDCQKPDTTVPSTNNIGLIIGNAATSSKQINMNNVSVKSTQDEEDIIPICSSNSQAVGIGFSTAPISAENIEIDNFKFAGVGSSYSTIHPGGLVGKTQSSVELKNSSIKNLTFDNTNAMIGGIVGYVGNKLTIDNVDIDNIDINSIGNNGYATGICAIVQQTTVIKNSTISNINIVSDLGSYHTSGLIGVQYSKSEISNCEISNIDITAKNTGKNSQAITGGLVAVNTGVELVVINNEISDIDINSNNVSTGGILGTGRIDTVGANANNSNSLDNITITSEWNNGSPFAGGAVLGNNCGQNSKIHNVTANNIKITSSSTCATIGGIVGLGAADLNSCTVKNSTIECKATTDNGQIPCVGGIAGLNNSTTYNQNNLTVENTTVKSPFGYIGGILGCCQGNVYKGKVTNSNIIGTTKNATVGGLVGLDAYYNNGLSITESSIEDSTVSTVGLPASSKTPTGITIHPAGGIIGYAGGLIKDCTVTRTTVESTGENAYATGGIVGHGNNTTSAIHTVIENCNVNDSIISGKDGVGGLAGVAVSVFKNSNVKGSITTGLSAPIDTQNATLGEKVEIVETNNSNDDITIKTEDVLIEESVKEIEAEDMEQEEIEEEAEASVIDDETDDEEVDETEEIETVSDLEDITLDENDETDEIDEIDEIDEQLGEEIEETQEIEEEKEEISEEVIIQEEIDVNIPQAVEEFILGDELLNATTSMNESIAPNDFVVQTLASQEETKSKVSGNNYVGGILGYAGTIIDGYVFVSINNCTVKDTKIEGKTDVKEDIGRSQEYPATYVPTIEFVETIIDFIKENVIVNILDE